MSFARPAAPSAPPQIGGGPVVSAAEGKVLGLLQRAKKPYDLLWHNGRVTDRRKDAELDLLIAMPGAGFVVVEVKGGQLSHDGVRWTQHSHDGSEHGVDPVTQARDAKYLLRSYVENDPRWGNRGRVRWAHAVIAPFTDIPADFALPDCPRSMIFGRNDLDELVERLAEIPLHQEPSNRIPSGEDVELLAEILHGRARPQADLLGAAEERELIAAQLTEQQGILLQVATLIRRLEVRGGAGSGKTWLALEQARRLARSGQRVALLCYSRGLASFLSRVDAGRQRKERAAYVGTFHGLGVDVWGAPGPGFDKDGDYWDTELPAAMVDIAHALPTGEKFDAVVVDEAQDFATHWWDAVQAALKDPAGGGLYLFSDSGQRIFGRSGVLPECGAVFSLEHNLRNTRDVFETFATMMPTRMRHRGGIGPKVRFVSCDPTASIEVADDQVDLLLDGGWRPEDVALLTTASRHPEHLSRLESGLDDYWGSYWDAEQVFYGSVLGFKGLERRVVVLAINGSSDRELSRERLYVGLSRATDQLVVCGDLEQIQALAGDPLARHLAERRVDMPASRNDRATDHQRTAAGPAGFPPDPS